MAYLTRDPAKALERHHHKFFSGHDIAARRWSLGPSQQRVPGLFVHEVAPGPRIAAWTYLTIGVWSAVHTDDGHGLEFLITAPEADSRMVELLTMTAYYDAGPESQRLDVGHTVPIGEPWLPMSACDHLLVGLPYASSITTMVLDRLCGSTLMITVHAALLIRSGMVGQKGSATSSDEDPS